MIVVVACVRLADMNDECKENPATLVAITYAVSSFPVRTRFIVWDMIFTNRGNYNTMLMFLSVLLC
jgi:hypothetical protein